MAPLGVGVGARGEVGQQGRGDDIAHFALTLGRVHAQAVGEGRVEVDGHPAQLAPVFAPQQAARGTGAGAGHVHSSLALGGERDNATCRHDAAAQRRAVLRDMLACNCPVLGLGDPLAASARAAEQLGEQLRAALGRAGWGTGQ